MTDRVFRLHSTIELPLDDVQAYLDNPELPAGLDDIELTRRNNTLIISAVAPEGTVGKYTPTAQIKGTVTETRVPDEEAIPQPANTTGWAVNPGGDEPTEQPTKLIEMAGFKGNLEAVLQNTALQYPMFTVLCDLARHASTGTLSAITLQEDALNAVRIVDGEDRPARIEIVEKQQEQTAGRGVDWRDNKYIK